MYRRPSRGTRVWRECPGGHIRGLCPAFRVVLWCLCRAGSFGTSWHSSPCPWPSVVGVLRRKGCFNQEILNRFAYCAGKSQRVVSKLGGSQKLQVEFV